MNLLDRWFLHMCKKYGVTVDSGRNRLLLPIKNLPKRGTQGFGSTEKLLKEK